MKTPSLKRWASLGPIAALLTAPFWIHWIFLVPYGQTLAAAFLIPIMAAALLAAIKIVERPYPLLQKLLVSSFLLKLLAVATYSWMTLSYYGRGDNLMYFGSSVAVGTMDQAVPFGARLTGTHFILRLTWLVTQLLGESFSATAFFFACLAFAGQWLFVHAAILHGPAMDRGLTVCLILFMPSVLFWSASIGKEAVILLGLGLFCLGFAKVVQDGMSWFPLTYGAVGLFLTMFVRPHIAAMLAIAAFSGFTMASGRRVRLGAAGRIAGWILLAASVAYLIPRAQSFLQLDELSIESTSDYLQMRIGQTDIGGSAFGVTSLAERVLLGPFLLFRPMPWEISSPTAALSSVEGLILLWLTWTRRRQLLGTARNVFKHPYVLFQVLFILEFIVAFSSISNWGIIARQRIMVYPMFFWLLGFRSQTIPARSKRRAKIPLRAASARAREATPGA